MVALFKRIVCKSYVIGLMAFTVWYGYFVYPLIFGFEGKEAAEESLKEAGNAGTREEQVFLRLIAERRHEQNQVDLGYRKIDQPYILGHFHNIGFTPQPDLTSACVRCHGNSPHAESKQARAFMNMHTFYLACETCHVPPAEGALPWNFRWHDMKTGNIVENPRAIRRIEEAYRGRQREYPVYGDYGAKITPSGSSASPLSQRHEHKELEQVERYQAERENLTPDARKKRLDEFHASMRTPAVRCASCHREDQPYIPFDQLGYPPSRVLELANNPVVGMLQKYDSFFLPNLLPPDGNKH